MISDYISDHLLYAVHEQLDVDDIEDMPINIFLNDGSSYFLSFIVNESEKYLNIVYTNSNGYEKIAILNKDYISSIQLCYLDELASSKVPHDLMCM